MTLFDRFKSPTPKVWRQLGNGLLAVSAAISGYTMYAEQPVVAAITMVSGVLGKFLTSFFVEDNTPQ
ncbi:MAG TPA: hypothetical protein PKC87_01875 [Candidatus Absconditabacterales bacterium]|nr:hypothetical protein [Candidatus Absconditabacterales bacterium]